MGCTWLVCSVCNSDFLTTDEVVSNLDDELDDDIVIVCHRCEPLRNGEHWVKINKGIVEQWDGDENIVSEGIPVELWEHDCIDCGGTFEDGEDVLINPRCDRCDYKRRKKSAEKDDEKEMTSQLFL